MINNIEIKSGDEQEFEPIPADMYECKIVDIKEKKNKKYQSDEEEDVIEFEFDILDGEYKGRKLWKKARPIIGTGYEGGSPSTLYQIITCVLGRMPEGRSFVEVVNSLQGKTVRLGVQTKDGKNGKKYNNVKEFYPSKVVAPAEPVEEGADVSDIDVSEVPF